MWGLHEHGVEPAALERNVRMCAGDDYDASANGHYACVWRRSCLFRVVHARQGWGGCVFGQFALSCPFGVPLDVAAHQRHMATRAQTNKQKHALTAQLRKG